ncbi:MAG: hypothetical protein RR441_11690, partial [Longicatena sp.]
PIFPGITDYQKIMETSKEYIDEFWFENLNLRGSYKQTVLSYIDEKYPHLHDVYQRIYVKKDMTYWKELSLDIAQYCENNNIQYTNYFYHEELVKKTKHLKQKHFE